MMTIMLYEPSSSSSELAAAELLLGVVEGDTVESVFDATVDANDVDDEVVVDDEPVVSS